MVDVRAMAFVNAYGVLATLENLCELDSDAKAICQGLKEPVGFCFDVINGPVFTLNFSKDGCKLTEGDLGCTMKMNFISPKAFNDLIDKSKPGIPTKNPIKTILFLATTFSKLAEILTRYLRPSEADMKNPEFFEKSTMLTMYTIAGAICALANNDEISKISASYIIDGDISMGITDKMYVTVKARNSILSLEKKKAENPRAVMEFTSIELANALFTGTASTMAELCAGNIYMRGMINMIDNVNRILDRVAVYLA
ncbi:MAG: hypothetical protein GX241_01195 [Ruminococcaceae bacterium]|nr:hypothetical protein [Oscillospiraceae bacterium]